MKMANYINIAHIRKRANDGETFSYRPAQKLHNLNLFAVLWCRPLIPEHPHCSLEYNFPLKLVHIRGLCQRKSWLD
jgi:hypothetical protein